MTEWLFPPAVRSVFRWVIPCSSFQPIMCSYHLCFCWMMIISAHGMGAGQSLGAAVVYRLALRPPSSSAAYCLFKPSNSASWQEAAYLCNQMCTGYGHGEGVSHVHCWLAIFTGENWWQPPFYGWFLHCALWPWRGKYYLENIPVVSACCIIPILSNDFGSHLDLYQSGDRFASALHTFLYKVNRFCDIHFLLPAVPLQNNDPFKKANDHGKAILCRARKPLHFAHSFSLFPVAAPLITVPTDQMDSRNSAHHYPIQSASSGRASNPFNVAPPCRTWLHHCRQYCTQFVPVPWQLSSHSCQPMFYWLIGNPPRECVQ